MTKNVGYQQTSEDLLCENWPFLTYVIQFTLQTVIAARFSRIGAEFAQYIWLIVRNYHFYYLFPGFSLYE